MSVVPLAVTILQAGGIPVLARSAGHYREAPPSLPLREHFQCLWTHKIPRELPGPIAVVPDGCVDLLWIEGRLAVAGPDISASLPALRPGSTVLGIRFQPGAAANWLGLSLPEIVGRQVDLCELWGSRARDLGDGIGEAATPAEGLARLQSGLTRLAATVERPARDMAMAFHFLEANTGEDGSNVIRLRHRLELSERTLRRRCRLFFGYGPKTLERILRFQRFLRLVQAAPKAGLSALALEAGYADQAHLSREVRSLSGLSPRSVARQLAG